MLGQSLVYAPGFNSAKACGARILHIIKREPTVRTEDKVKDKMDWVSFFFCLLQRNNLIKVHRSRFRLKPLPLSSSLCCHYLPATHYLNMRACR